MTSPPKNVAAIQAATAHIAHSDEAHSVAVQSQLRLRSGVAPQLASLADDIASITGYYDNFSGAILDIERLVETKVDSSLNGYLYRLLYVNVVTALETYLSDAFINSVIPNSERMRRFIETTPEFQSQKIAVSKVFTEMEGIQDKAKAYLMDVVWHNLERVKPMYRATLGVEFPSEPTKIFQAVLIRHDIVHRNGKTKDGVEVKVTQNDILNLIGAVEDFVQHVDKQLSQVKTD